MDLNNFAEAFKRSFDAQLRLFPDMMNDKIEAAIDQYKDQALGWKLSGAGAGGYLILVSEKPIENAMKIADNEAREPRVVLRALRLQRAQGQAGRGR
jgi:galactokinase/mevalonate kinase-like predicted kinase